MTGPFKICGCTRILTRCIGVVFRKFGSSLVQKDFFHADAGPFAVEKVFADLEPEHHTENDPDAQNHKCLMAQKTGRCRNK